MEWVGMGLTACGEDGLESCYCEKEKWMAFLQIDGIYRLEGEGYAEMKTGGQTGLLMRPLLTWGRPFGAGC